MVKESSFQDLLGADQAKHQQAIVGRHKGKVRHQGDNLLLKSSCGGSDSTAQSIFRTLQRASFIFLMLFCATNWIEIFRLKCDTEMQHKKGRLHRSRSVFLLLTLQPFCDLRQKHRMNPEILSLLSLRARNGSKCYKKHARLSKEFPFSIPKSDKVQGLIVTTFCNCKLHQHLLKRNRSFWNKLQCDGLELLCMCIKLSKWTGWHSLPTLIYLNSYPVDLFPAKLRIRISMLIKERRPCFCNNYTQSFVFFLWLISK